MHSETGSVRPNPIQRTVRTVYLSVPMTVHSLSIQYNTEQFWSPLNSRQPPQLSCCLSEEKGPFILQTNINAQNADCGTGKSETPGSYWD